MWPAVPWAQEIYRSVDAAGHVNYSDQPDMSNSMVEAQPGNDASVADISASTAPPPLPTSDQPPCPEEGDLWTPGYWAWDGAAYYWVPGAWVPPPRLGVFWTPAYWAYIGTVFVFHRGYWGPQVGFYGGVNYGFGYGGIGYVGGRWVGNAFAYNRAVNNVNANVFRHVYDEPVVSHEGYSRVSYNGGPGGTLNVPNAQERLAAQSRLASPPQRMQLQPAPNRTPSIAPGVRHAALTPNPVVSHTAAASVPRPVTTSAVTQQRASANTVVRPAPAPRPSPSPTIKSIPIK
ncbi:MAG: DUF4124 domain-containing protein [Steroidobacteraceae bacterium]